MAAMKQDIFTALSVVHIINTILGPVFFSLTGPTGCRKLVIKKKNLLLLTFKIISGVCVCILAGRDRIHQIKNYEIEHIPEFCAIFSCFVMFLTIPLSEIIYHKRILEVYYTMQNVCCYLKRSGFPFDYCSVKKYSLILFGLKMFISAWVIFDYLVYGIISLFLFYIFADIVVICVEMTVTTLLYSVYRITVKINDMILKIENMNKGMEDDKYFLHEMLNIHDDLRKICLNTITICKYIILQFFVSYSGVVFSAFKVAKDISFGLPFIWTIDLVLWNIFNLFGTTHVICRCVIMKNEVRI